MKKIAVWMVGEQVPLICEAKTPEEGIVLAWNIPVPGMVSLIKRTGKEVNREYIIPIANIKNMTVYPDAQVCPNKRKEAIS